MVMDEYAEEIDLSASLCRHWCPISEQYTTGDALLTALDQGWKISGVIFCQEFWLAGVRRTLVYHIDLRRGSEKIKMPVLYNPYLSRLLQRLDVQVVQLNQHRQIQSERL